MKSTISILSLALLLMIGLSATSHATVTGSTIGAPANAAINAPYGVGGTGTCGGWYVVGYMMGHPVTMPYTIISSDLYGGPTGGGRILKGSNTPWWSTTSFTTGWTVVNQAFGSWDWYILVNDQVSSLWSLPATVSTP